MRVSGVAVNKFRRVDWLLVSWNILLALLTWLGLTYVL